MKHWASSLNSRLDDADVIIHGHTDEVGLQTSDYVVSLRTSCGNFQAKLFEVMSHSAMYSLAHCQLVDNVASGALWMPMGNPANAFRSDFPVEGRPHSIGVLDFPEHLII